MKLIIISGAPATGKSTIGLYIARRRNYSSISKDTLKEKLYESETTPSWHYWWYERQAKNLFFEQLSLAIAADQNLIIEANFVTPDIKRLQTYLDSKVIISEIYCPTNGLTSFKRFVTLNESGNRHHGYNDRQWYLPMLVEAMLRYFGIAWPYTPTHVASTLLRVNTTYPALFALDSILDFCTSSGPDASERD